MTLLHQLGILFVPLDVALVLALDLFVGNQRKLSEIFVGFFFFFFSPVKGSFLCKLWDFVRNCRSTIYFCWRIYASLLNTVRNWKWYYNRCVYRLCLLCNLGFLILLHLNIVCIRSICTHGFSLQSFLSFSQTLSLLCTKNLLYIRFTVNWIHWSWDCSYWLNYS